jgi:hypothetical protein
LASDLGVRAVEIREEDEFDTEMDSWYLRHDEQDQADVESLKA